MPRIQTGLEHLVATLADHLKGQRVGLLCNPASVDGRLRHARHIIHQMPDVHITALFSPQHGFFSEKQDNMVESDHGHDAFLNVPVYSLYGRSRTPEPAMLADIDTLIVDLQDVGTRVYTFIYTMSYCLEAARNAGCRVLVLDRPNPVGGRRVEGNLLSPPMTSFVGRYPIPMRHGMTIGELALLFNRYFGIGCELEVVPMQGWRRDMLFAETGLPWVAPSPNLPSPVSALVYPGQVVWEGTNVSEGRGTTQPFELFGAPYLNPAAVRARLANPDPPGVIFRETAFEPMFNKWNGILCRGFQIHVTAPSLVKPYETTLDLLQAVIACHGDVFEWKKPPYEYETEKAPIDLIIGDRNIRMRLERQEPLDDIIRAWSAELAAFERLKQSFHLYD